MQKFCHEAFCEIIISTDFHVMNMLGWADTKDKAMSIVKMQINNPAAYFEINWYKNVK